jgi:hypothetical protein
MSSLLLLFILFSFCRPVAGIAVTESSADILLLGGTVMSIDQDSLSVTLRLPGGETRLFAVVDRRWLRDISLGDHVTYELNDAGKIIRLVKLPTDPAN